MLICPERVMEYWEVCCSCPNNGGGSTDTYTKKEIDDKLAEKASESEVESIYNALSAHTSDTVIHISQSDRDRWDGKQDALVAGSGISIVGGVISATGSSVVVDPTLDSGSTNPVANSAITNALLENEQVISTALNGLENSKQDALVAGSGISIANNVISVTGGSSITVDSAIDSASTNPVENRVIADALDDKADVSTTYTKTEVDNIINNITSTQVSIWCNTQAAYDALTEIDPNVLYLVID